MFYSYPYFIQNRHGVGVYLKNYTSSRISGYFLILKLKKFEYMKNILKIHLMCINFVPLSKLSNLLNIYKNSAVNYYAPVREHLGRGLSGLNDLNELIEIRSSNSKRERKLGLLL